MFIEIATNKEELRDIIGYTIFDYEGVFMRPCWSDEYCRRFDEVASRISYPVVLAYTESLDPFFVGEWRIIDLDVDLYEVIPDWKERKEEMRKMLEEKYRKILDDAFYNEIPS